MYSDRGGGTWGEKRKKGRGKTKAVTPANWEVRPSGDVAM